LQIAGQVYERLAQGSIMQHGLLAD